MWKFNPSTGQWEQTGTSQFNYNFGGGSGSTQRAPQYNFSANGPIPVQNPNSFGLVPSNYSNLASYGNSTVVDGGSTPQIDLTSSDVNYQLPYQQTEQMSVPGKSITPAAAGTGLGWNMGTAQIALGGLQTLGNLWSAFEQAGIAKDQLAYTKKIGDANLANQIKSYNTNLSDKANMDAVVGGWSPEQTAAYVSKNQLTGK